MKSCKIILPIFWVENSRWVKSFSSEQYIPCERAQCPDVPVSTGLGSIILVLNEGSTFMNDSQVIMSNQYILL